MELVQNFVAEPPPDQTDGVCINITEEERHGAARSEGLGGYVVGLKSQFLANVGVGDAECPSEHRAGNISPPVPHLDGA